MADLISPAQISAITGKPSSKWPFWDVAPTGVYVQFDERLITPWERVTLAGIPLPGRCSVVSPGRIRKQQAVAGPGDEGEKVIDLGATAADVSIGVQIWTPEHLTAWQEWTEHYQAMLVKARVEAEQGEAKVPGLDVIHPGLNMAGIWSLLVYQITVMAPGQVRGTFEAQILGTEFLQVKPAKGTGKASQAVGATDASLSTIINGIPFDEKVRSKSTGLPLDTEAKP